MLSFGFMGLWLFCAVRRHGSGAGDAEEPAFSKFIATVSVMTSFRFGEQNFVLSPLLSGQYSPDNLFEAEQI